LDGILLQRQVSSGIEALVGVTTDPLFGLLLVCGLGGTLVEVLHGRTFRLTPLSDINAEQALPALQRAEQLADELAAVAPGIARAIEGAPCWQAHWPQTTASEFLQIFWQTTQPQQTTVPGFTS
jgi:hypothetical protein